MPIYDPLAAKFADKTLDPWQRSVKKFDFDPEFVKWIQKYLEKLECNSELVMAKSWINGANYAGKRRDDCELQWEAYQESLNAKQKPVLRAMDADCELHSGDPDCASESNAVGAVDAPIEPDLPDEFARLEGESGSEYAARMMRISREKIKQIGSW